MKTDIPPSRRRFIALGAAAVAAAPSIARAQAAPTIVVSSAPDEDILGTAWGIQSGIFKKYGLNVTLQASNSGSAVAAAVVGGAVNIGKSSLFSLLQAHLRGIPFQLIAAAGVYKSAADSTVDLIVKTGGPIRTAKDLDGKTLAVQALNDQFVVAIDARADQNGGQSSSLHFLELPNSADAAAINEGRVDGAALTNPNLAQALATGEVRSIGHPFDAIAHEFIQAAYFSTQSYIQANQKMVETFARAVAESNAYVDAHHEQTAPALAAFTKVPLNVIGHMARTQLAAKLQPNLIQPLIDTAVKYKALAKSFPAQEMIAPFALPTG